MRMKGCSSGGPVFVTLGDDNPVVVAIHSESGVRTDALNKGAPCGPSYRGRVFKKTDNIATTKLHDIAAHAIFV